MVLINNFSRSRADATLQFATYRKCSFLLKCLTFFLFGMLLVHFFKFAKFCACDLMCAVTGKTIHDLDRVFALR